MQFTEVARRRADPSFADRCRKEAAWLRQQIEQRTLCRRRRCLCAATAHRSGGMVMVHRLGRLAVPADRGITAGAEAGGGQTACCAVLAG